MTTGSETIRLRLLIGGERVEGSDERPVTNPADADELVGIVPIATAAHVDAAVALASAAAAPWAAWPVGRRVAAVKRVAGAIRRRREELATLLVRENGKVRAEAEDEIERTLTFIDRACASAAAFLRSPVAGRREGLAVGCQALGVVAVIAPWNAPVILTMRRAVPALLMGNSVILKPSTSAPFTVAAIAELLAQELPAGTVSLLLGGGDEIGQRLASHAGIRAIAFTGSTEAGRSVLRAAASNLTRSAMELGGNDPAIVLADAPLTDSMLTQLVRGAFRTSGQRCFAIKRIYVEEPLYARFAQLFMEQVDRLVVGNGLDDLATMGPLNNRRQFDFVSGLVDDSRKSGLRVEELGRALDPASWGRGNFLRPTVVFDAPVDARVVACEQFGPIVPVVPVRDADAAAELVNAGDFGLRASVWSGDQDRARRIAPRLQVGVVGINRLPVPPIHMNFVGAKHSGVGRESIRSSFEEYVTVQAVLE